MRPEVRSLRGFTVLTPAEDRKACQERCPANERCPILLR